MPVAPHRELMVACGYVDVYLISYTITTTRLYVAKPENRYKLARRPCFHTHSIRIPHAIHIQTQLV